MIEINDMQWSGIAINVSGKTIAKSVTGKLIPQDLMIRTTFSKRDVHEHWFETSKWKNIAMVKRLKWKKRKW